MEAIHVLSTLRFAEGLLQQLRSVSPCLHVIQQTCHDAGEVASVLAGHPQVEVLYTFDLPPDVLELAPRLRWIQLHSAGAEHVMDNPVAASNVAITTVSGIHATPIAEYVLASMLAHRWQVAMWTQLSARGQVAAG